MFGSLLLGMRIKASVEESALCGEDDSVLCPVCDQSDSTVSKDVVCEGMGARFVYVSFAYSIRSRRVDN